MGCLNACSSTGLETSPWFTGRWVRVQNKVLCPLLHKNDEKKQMVVLQGTAAAVQVTGPRAAFSTRKHPRKKNLSLRNYNIKQTSGIGGVGACSVSSRSRSLVESVYARRSYFSSSYYIIHCPALAGLPPIRAPLSLDPVELEGIA
ncbi:unnamed protein product [Ectocarpus sp. 12 AP-2014]